MLFVPSNLWQWSESKIVFNLFLSVCWQPVKRRCKMLPNQDCRDLHAFSILGKLTAWDTRQKGPQHKASPVESTLCPETVGISIWLLYCCTAWSPQIFLTFLYSGTVLYLIQVTKLKTGPAGKSVAAEGMFSCSLALCELSYSWKDNPSNKDLNKFSCQARRYIYCC